VDSDLNLSPVSGTLTGMTTELISLERLLRRQHAIVTRDQLRSCSVPEARWRAQIAGGRWRSLNDAVICGHNGPLTVEQARWATVLSAPPPAALSGLTAMQTWGVSGFGTPSVHVLVERGARVLRVPDVAMVVHESRRFNAADICGGRLPLTTGLERSVIDAAVWSPDSWTASRIVVAPIQQQHTSADALRRTLDAAGFVKHRKVLLALLADLDGGAEALSEVAFLRWCRRHGFPKPTLQVRLDAFGRRRYIDAVFTTADGNRVFVEIDGGIHLTLATRWKDSAKDNDAAIARQVALRFPSIAVHSDDPIAIHQLRAALDVVGLTRCSGDVRR
jgi:hypothetical protein